MIAASLKSHNPEQWKEGSCLRSGGGAHSIVVKLHVEFSSTFVTVHPFVALHLHRSAAKSKSGLDCIVDYYICAYFFDFAFHASIFNAFIQYYTVC